MIYALGIAVFALLCLAFWAGVRVQHWHANRLRSHTGVQCRFRTQGKEYEVFEALSHSEPLL